MSTSLRTEAGPYFGDFGGRFVPESLVAALDELTNEYALARQDPAFAAELMELHRTYTGRPSIITEVPRFAAHAGGARIILKRDDLTHTGSPKLNQVLGQALLTKRIGKSRVIAETGAGQHGVAAATAADVAHYHAAGADIVLVGEALVTSDPIRTLSEFLAV